MKRIGAIFVMAAVGLLSACAPKADAERFPTSKDYPPGVMERFSFRAGGDSPWKLSALKTPNDAAPWKMVVITGTPSWSEFWAPTLAAAPKDLQIVVADRPGFADSEPKTAVTDISIQAAALSALVDGPADQKVILVGQSYGTPVATLIAAARPDKVKALVLMSSFYGEWGPTAQRLRLVGSVFRGLLPRDLKNGLDEIKHQKPQLAAAEAALGRLTIPVLVMHGDKDSFVPPSFADVLVKKTNPESHARALIVKGGDHFLNACCVGDIIGAVESEIAEADVREAAQSSD